MDFKDYYKSLGLKKRSNDKEVKSAFKKLAKQYHPDADGGSEDKFKEINEAYEVLKDKDKRERYDYLYSHVRDTGSSTRSKRSQDFKQQKMYSNYESFSDFYKQKEEDLRKSRAKGDRKPEDYKREDYKRGPSDKEEGNFSDFFEMFFGKHKERSGMKEETNGRGAKSETSKKASRGEDYEMEIELSLEDAYHGTIRKIEITGANKTVRRLEVSIPPGVSNGTKIKVANEGKPGKNGGDNGDLFLRVQLKAHDNFWLEGDDVHSELVIEPHEAVLGSNKKIPTLEDFVEMVIPPSTHNGRTLRLRNKGMKNSSGEILGDHYVHVLIDIVADLSDEEITTYKYLRELSDKR